jgi:hypothetical protein
MEEAHAVVSEYKGFKIAAYATPADNEERWLARLEFLPAGRGCPGDPCVERVDGDYATREEALEAALRRAQRRIEQMPHGGPV